MERANMRMKYRVFQSGTRSWESLFDEVAAFATQLGPRRVAGISHSEGREGWLANGVVTVWYWGGDGDRAVDAS
jgi:hypothetical protein